MDWFKFCSLICCFVAFCESSDQYFFVITPNVIRFNHAETVLVSIFGKQKNVEVSVWLQYRNKQFSHKSVTVLDEGTPENTTIKVTEADIFDTVIDEKPRIIELCSQQTTTICKDIILSYKTGYLILQTDKPIYTPRQEVKIRLLALDESLRKITGDNLSIHIAIVSPSNHTLGRRSFATTISGFYQKTFTLPSDPEIGMWTVLAFYGGKYETTARSSFQIKEYVLPTFGVTVDASKSYILLSDSNDTKVEFTIKAKYVYGKPVEGTARISLNVKDEAGDSKSLTNLKRKELQNGVAEFSIKKGNLFKSDALKAEAFHDGSRLGVVATVFESATGKEESTLKNDIVLDTEPYIFKFTRSKRYFRPGIEYFFKIDVFTPNNVPATDVKLQVLKLDKSGRFIHEKNVETDGKGQALAILPTTYEDRLILKVIAEGSSPSQTFEVLPYDDRNQINVESIIKDDIMLMRVISNMQIMYNPGSSRSSYTGIMFVVVTRGKVVHAIFKESSNVASEQIKDTLQELITPTARLLVFYVDKKSDRVVADSIKIDLDAKCKGSGLVLEPNRYDVAPGSRNKIKITGTPYSWVGLNVMDKALLLQNDKNILMENKMFDALRSHDLGCGAGSGKNNGDVFKNAGLFILTNALVTTDLYRSSEECDTRTRKKRSVDGALEDISHYENDLKSLAEDHIRLHIRTDFRGSFLFEEVQLDVNGEAERGYKFPESVTEWMIQAIGITENDGICIADPIDVTVFRNFFVQLDLPYKATRFELFDVKATLFSYGMEEFQHKQVNVYLEAFDGLCYGTQPGKPSSRKWVDVGPNTASTVRFPVIPMKAGKFSVKITAIATEFGIPMVDVIEKDLFVVNEGVQDVITIQVCLDPNKENEDCLDHDRVKTKIFEQPGTRSSEQLSEIDLTLPNIAIEGTGSATAYVQGKTMDNVVKTILSGVDSLFPTPHGNGESTIATTAPTVYAMMYLKCTKQVTEAIEVIGYRNIQYGLYREKNTFRHSDGSYSCCNNDKYTGTYRESSVWLTAFVAKVFCYANSVIDLLDDNVDILPTIDFLRNQMNAAGMYTEIQDTRYGSWLKGATREGNTPSLTAFVLISLLECNIMRSSLNRNIVSATKYLESLDKTWLKRNPFDLAITTYALALAKSEQKWIFKNLLESIKTESGNQIYWANPSNSEKDSHSTETTAYALLAMLELNDMTIAGNIVRWLTSQQNAQSVFKSTQDTVVGLQALSEYYIRTYEYTQDVDLNVSFITSNGVQRGISIKNKKTRLQQIVDKLPIEEDDSKLIISVTGTSGSGMMRIELRYNRPAEDDQICPYDLSDIEVGDVYKLPADQNIINLWKCDVCGNCAADNPTMLTTVDVTTASNFDKTESQPSPDIVHNMKCIRFSVRAKPGNEHGMSMIFFNLETDVTVLKEDLEKIIKDNDNMDDYEIQANNNGFIVFYLKTLTSRKNEFMFRLIDNMEGDKSARQPVSVEVFDYQDKEKYCRKIYGIGPYKGAALDYACDSKKKHCTCLISRCSTPVEKKILKMIKARRKPAIEMSRYTCNPEKANFADIVKVTEISNDKSSKDVKAIAKVMTNVHRGASLHATGDDIKLFWKATCPFPKLEVGKEYLIIAKDGFRAQCKDGDYEYQYSLMDTALVIENKKTGPMRKVIMLYKLWMKKHGCLNK